MTFAMSKMVRKSDGKPRQHFPIDQYYIPALQEDTIYQDDHLSALSAISQPGRRHWEHEGHAEGDQERREPQDVERPQQGDDSFRSACTESCPTGARILFDTNLTMVTMVELSSCNELFQKAVERRPSTYSVGEEMKKDRIEAVR